jgi:ABC-type bacteriocin/lantibiotic exporter with double-glycine peptidase domain
VKPEVMKKTAKKTLKKDTEKKQELSQMSNDVVNNYLEAKDYKNLELYIENTCDIKISEKEIAKIAGTNRLNGTSATNLIKVAEQFGFKTILKDNATLNDLQKFITKKIPVIVDWFSTHSEPDGHYSVVVDINKKNILLQDPLPQKSYLS